MCLLHLPGHADPLRAPLSEELQLPGVKGERALGGLRPATRAVLATLLAAELTSAKTLNLGDS